jgi:hypothetical protein
MFTALRATSLTLIHLLREHFVADSNLAPLFDPGMGGTMLISMNSPQEMDDLPAQGLSFWLYRVHRDAERLNAPPERLNRSQVARKPLPVILHYLMTPIVNLLNPISPQTEQMILGKGLQVLHDHPIVRGAVLQDDFTGTTVELHAHLESLALEELSRIFDALERSYQLSVSYEISVVEIASGHEPGEAHPVDFVIPQYSVIVSPPES